MTSIHEAAGTGFQRAADAYAAARPTYPGQAIDAILDGVGDDERVVDLAAGTGKLTSLLVERDRDVVAIEPVEAMVALVEGARRLRGTAEAIPMRSGSVGLVTAAQAFHWFDAVAAGHEIARVLRPGGVLAVVFNIRNENDLLWAEVAKLIEPHRRDTPAHRDRVWQAALDAHPALVRDGLVTSEWAQPLDRAALRTRVSSISFVASLDADVREPLLDEVEGLVPAGLHYALPHRTEVHRFRTLPR